MDELEWQNYGEYEMAIVEGRLFIRPAPGIEPEVAKRAWEEDVNALVDAGMLEMANE